MTEHVETTGDPNRSVRLGVEHLTKTFPGNRALDDVSLSVRSGEIHALVGGNGSGKSTLIKVLSGVYQGDSGRLDFAGRSVDTQTITPEISRAHGVRVVHQDLGVFLGMSVAENLALGSVYERHPLGGIRWRALKRRARDLIERFEIDADPDTQLGALGKATHTQVAIARAMQDHDASSGLLILDEATAALPAHEVEMLLNQLRRYAAAGQSILYVSHRLDEILSIADRVTALRDGKFIGTYPREELDEKKLVDLILGRQVESALALPPAAARTDTLLEMQGVSSRPLRDVDLQVSRGEIVGLAGLLGSGHTQLLRVAFGDLRLSSGRMTLNGHDYQPQSPADAIRAGVAYVPEDRFHESVFLDATVGANIAMPALAGYFRGGRVSDRSIGKDAAEDMQAFSVRAVSPSALLSSLSGGNQQKVVMARWLRLHPDLLLLDEPTHGVDVGARADIYRIIRDATDRGAGAIVIASDFEELAAVSDRVIVFHSGRVVAELRGDEVTVHAVTQAAHQLKAKEQ